MSAKDTLLDEVAAICRRYDGFSWQGEDCAKEILALAGKEAVKVVEGWVVVHAPTRSLNRPRNRDEIIAALRELFGMGESE